MQYIDESKKSVESVASDLEANIKKNSFGVLHMYDLKETMHEKGIELAEECRIYEICNPKLALEVLSEDMSMNMVLPCRISVYSDNGVTKVGMINPTTLMHESSHKEALKEVAKLVETKIKEIIQASI